ncbi:hypothetical protein HYV82_02335 [Candidatus Woesearchaeota archaeon]|nr:hypothetical protein [Candidatus Woesearchaeota archaeon]
MAIIYNAGAGLANAYRTAQAFRESVNTAVIGASVYVLPRIVAHFVSQATGDRTATELAEAWAPLVGSAAATSYAWRSPSDFVRIFFGIGGCALTGYTLGTGITNTDPSLMPSSELEDMVSSARRIVKGNEGFLAIAGGVLGVLRRIRR